MTSVRWPALAPALSILGGSLLALELRIVTVAPLAILAALGLALWRPWSRQVTVVALATLHGALVLGGVDHGGEGSDADRPAVLTVRPVEAWRPARYGATTGGWRADARVLRFRQGDRVGHGPAMVTIEVRGAAPPPSGRALRVEGYLQRRPGYANRGRPVPGPWRVVVKSRRLVETRERDPLLEWSTRLRRRIEAPFLAAVAARDAAPLDSPGLGVSSALLLGDRDRLDGSWKLGLRRFGLSHLLAVSGLHVALLLAPVLVLTRSAGAPAQLLLASGILGLYVLLVGPRPSLLRAAVMALLVLLTRATRRSSEALNSLAVAVAMLLIVEPELVGDLGFQLTVAATAGILVLVPWWNGVNGPPRRLLQRSLQISLAAQVATLPWVLSRFALWSPLSPLANLVAVPWTGLCLLAAIAVAILCQLLPGAAAPALRLLDLLAAPFGWPALVEPWSLLGRTGLFALVPLPIALVAAGGMAVAVRYPRPAAGAAVATLLWWAMARGTTPAVRHGAEVVLLDVGQGDAVLLHDERVAILVDGGGTAGGNLALQALLPGLASAHLHTLDVGVLSHPDRDHCQGLLDLSRLVPIGELWLPDVPLSGGCATALVERFAGRTRRLSAGDVLARGGWHFDVLHPGDSLSARRNRASLVLRARWAGVGVLLTGDIDSGVERELARRQGALLESDVLKIPHHGSRSSSSAYLLDRVRPRLGLLSVGEGNPYGHPSPEVVERYRNRRIMVVRSDRNGMVALRWTPTGPLVLHTTGR